MQRAHSALVMGVRVRVLRVTTAPRGPGTWLAEAAVMLLLLLRFQEWHKTVWGGAQAGRAASGWGTRPRSLRADALLAELEQSSRPASKDCMLQVPSSCKQDPATAGPPAPRGREPPASAALKVTPQHSGAGG